MKTIIAVFISIIATILIDAQEVKKLHEFDKNTIKLFEQIPIQDDGRIKPIKTYASFLLLRFNGKRNVMAEKNSASNPSDQNIKLDPTTWLMLTLFYPEQIKALPVLLIDNSDVLIDLGAKVKNQRDRYSYSEIEPYIDALMNKAEIIKGKKKDDRTDLETQLFQLALNVRDYQILIHGLDFARKKDFKSKIPINLNSLPLDNLIRIEKIADSLKDSPEFQSLPEENLKIALNELSDLHRQNYILLDASRWMTIFPPLTSDNKKWLHPVELLLEEREELQNWQNVFGKLSECLENTYTNEADQHIKDFTDALLEKVSQVKNYSEIHYKNNLEIQYLNLDLIYIALQILVLAFLSISFQLVGKNKLWNNANFLLISIATILTIVAITMRCIILSRPPVATLYETIIFITAGILLICLFIEFIFKNKVGLFVAAMLGATGLFLSYKYEMSEGTDTMGNLVAVLNSNFWLATHVTTINIGYLAGLLVSGLAHVWLVLKVFKLNTNKVFLSDLKKIIYGVLCFCIIFSIIGTILGGVWANDSWGRFWGWDPKENGALAIVLWVLIILHARLGGILKEFGINIMNVLLGVVVTASWWGVNQLGVGLHSYGFTNGIVRNLLIFWAIEIIFIIIVACVYYLPKKKGANQSNTPPPTAG